MPVPLLIVGGFLGAGKTTLLYRAAARLGRQGLRVGLVTNDQAADLVDTGLLEARGLPVREVAGSCFCCDFPALLRQAQLLKDGLGADVLLAEPVGSCTDLSATILQPFKDRHAHEFRIRRLSVLVDPVRLRVLLDGGRGDGLHPSAVYILRKQIEEADILVVNRADTLADGESTELRARAATAFPGHEIRWMSALADHGVGEWLAAALDGGPAGSRVLDIDYDTYAEGEAVLGWLNATVHLASRTGHDWGAFCSTLLGRLREEITARGLPVGHVKMLLSAGGQHQVASLTRSGGALSVEGRTTPSRDAMLTVNARVETSPEELEGLVRRALAAAAGAAIAADVRTMRALRPGRPVPTYRYASVV